jgi:hypothetical protein
VLLAPHAAQRVLAQEVTTRFRVQGLGLRVQGLGLGVKSLGVFKLKSYRLNPKP